MVENPRCNFMHLKDFPSPLKEWYRRDYAEDFRKGFIMDIVEMEFLNENGSLTTSRRLTCIHAKLFPTVKRRTCIHVLWHYSRNSYFGRHAIFSESSGSRLGDPGQKALQTTIKPTLFVVFCLIPLSNTCSFVRPARNVNREIFLHCQEGFCVGKFGRVVGQAVLDNRPLRKHFRRSRLHYKRQALLKI